MQTDIAIRNNMLQVAVDEILALVGNGDEDTQEKKLRFLDAGDNPLAFIHFETISLKVGGESGSSVYEFKFNSGNTLFGSVTNPGTVAKFEILGWDGAAVSTVFSGTVGNLSSQTDIKFNVLEWTADQNMTINGLRLLLPNGV